MHPGAAVSRHDREWLVAALCSAREMLDDAPDEDVLCRLSLTGHIAGLEAEIAEMDREAAEHNAAAAEPPAFVGTVEEFKAWLEAK